MSTPKRYEAPPIVCSYDNLRIVMRQAYLDLTEDNLRPTHIYAGKKALIGYESISTIGHQNKPVTLFKGLPILLDPHMDGDRMEFICGRHSVVAVIEKIS